MPLLMIFLSTQNMQEQALTAMELSQRLSVAMVRAAGWLQWLQGVRW